MIVEANGLHFHVEVEGEGVPVVLLHGFPDTSRLWLRQVPALVEAGYRTIAPDLRDALGVERAHVVGHDWGAGVAWLLAALEPSRVERLVAISVGFPGAAGRPDLEALQKGWYRLLFQFEGVAEDLLRRDDWYMMRVLLGSNADLNRYLEDFSEPEALTAALNWYRANLPVERLLAPAPQLPRVQAPALGIWSTGDLYLTEHGMTASGEWVAGSWRYERIEDAGHWIPLDQPDRLNALLLEFLAG